ncbi:MAG TPA: tRNA dihydrouridine synthase DusB [Clostridia bacterium]|nr:tRNA dihydrouridine synthase DusB [Clostridia bacterium]
MEIDTVVLSNPVIAAPMAGVSDKAYRILAREQGCGLVYTEMISAQALIYQNQRTWQLLDIQEEESPVAVQIFGSDPDMVARGAALAEKAGASLVDINMGCPAPKITKNGEGASLMLNPSLAEKIVEETVRAVRVPVTVKIRKGWDEKSINAVEFARMLAGAGASAITVHGRTRDQYYSGKADWEIISQVAEAVSIPVVGNGDVWEPLDAFHLLKKTGCQGVMIGRASLGNPWIFRRTVTFLQEGRVLPEPGLGERVQMALRHLDLVVQDKGEERGVREMRKHLAWYIKGSRNASRVRDQVFQSETVSQVVEIFHRYLAEMEAERE